MLLQNWTCEMLQSTYQQKLNPVKISYYMVMFRGSQSLESYVTISQRYYQPLLTSNAICIGNNGKTDHSVQRLVAKVKTECIGQING